MRGMVGAEPRMARFDRELSSEPSFSPQNAALLVAFGTGPFYLFPSGYPQIGDVVLAAWAVLVAVRAIFKNALRVPTLTNPYFYFLSLLMYMACSNIAWAAATSDAQFARPALFAFFNLIISIACFSSLPSQSFCRALALGAATSLAVCVAAAPFTYVPGTSRQVFTFNNPNQMGYYALLCSTIFMQTRHSLGPRAGRFGGAAVALTGLALTAFSNSKAALVAFGFFMLFNFWRDRAIALVLAGFIAAALLLGSEEDSQVAHTIARIEAIGSDSDDSAEGRGYDRILAYPQHLLLGAGEARHERFSNRPGVAMELHSTIGTVVFSYGLPGIILFTIGLVALIRSATIVQVVPALLYGLTHQGLRQPLFWISLVIASAAYSPRIRGALTVRHRGSTNASNRR